MRSPIALHSPINPFLSRTKEKRLSYFCTVLALGFLSSIVHAVTLGQITIADPVLGSRLLVFEKKEGFALVEEDLLVGTLSQLSKKRASILPKLGGGRWPNKIIPFEFSNELPAANQVAALKAMAIWRQQASIHFIELNDNNRDQYPDYLSFVPSTMICASYVGRQKGPQLVILAPRCHTMTTAHEIGHALGLWHEQSRADRDHYVRILWENIDPDHRFNFDQHLTDGIDYGDYDYESIMHYSAYAFSNNGEKTIIPWVDGTDIGQRDHLSKQDIAAVLAMYSE